MNEKQKEKSYMELRQLRYKKKKHNERKQVTKKYKNVIFKVHKYMEKLIVTKIEKVSWEEKRVTEKWGSKVAFFSEYWKMR